MDGTGMSPADLKALMSPADGAAGGLGGNMGTWLILLLLFLGRGGGLLGNSGAAVDANTGLGFETFEKIGEVGAATQQGFYNTQTALNNVSQESSEAISDLRFAMQQCCCDTQKSVLEQSSIIQAAAAQNANKIDQVSVALNNSIMENRFQQQQNYQDLVNRLSVSEGTIINAGSANTQRIVDLINSQEFAELTSENNDLKSQISQANQTAAILAVVGRCCPTSPTVADVNLGGTVGVNLNTHA